METKVKIGAETMAEDMAMTAEPLSPRSAMFAHTDSTYIIATIGFDTPIDSDIFREKIPQTLLCKPRFSSLLVGDEKKSDELRWVHVSNVNLDNHIIVPSINPKFSKNTNSLEANKFVEDYIHNLTKTSLDTSKPLWDVHLLNLKTSEAESVGIFRFHHALGDGTSLISLILSFSRQLSDPDALPTIPTMKNKKKDVNTSYYGKLPWRFVMAIWWWLQAVWNTVTGCLRCLVTTYFLKDSDLFVKADPEAKNKPRRIVHKTISLDDMKLVKNAMNSSINDVALGITEAGFSRYLIRRLGNGDIKEEKKANSFLKKLRMTITMAVNIRARKGIQRFDNMESGKVGWGNRIGFVLLPLSIGSRNDPLAYVSKAKALSDRIKTSFEATCNLKINEIATKLFGIQVAGSMWLKYTSHVSVLFSNVPGPVEQVTLFGHPMKFIAPSLCALSTPVVIHFQSYVNEMTIILSVREDSIFMEDPHQLCEDIAQSLILCKQAINM
ncbi:hypothetical protein V2J09_024198 [Rumex salicifolius]